MTNGRPHQLQILFFDNFYAKHLSFELAFQKGFHICLNARLYKKR